MLCLDAEPSQSLPVTVETEVQGDGGEGRAGLGAPSVSGPGSMHTYIKWANGKEGRRKDGGGGNQENEGLERKQTHDSKNNQAESEEQRKREWQENRKPEGKDTVHAQDSASFLINADAGSTKTQTASCSCPVALSS